MKQLRDSVHVAGEVALGPLRHALAAPANKHILGQAGVGVLDLDKGELDLSVGEVLDHVDQLTLAGGLDLEHAFLAGIRLEGIGERRLDCEDGPLAISWRVGGGDTGDGPFWERLSEAMAGQKTTACTRGRQAWWGC
jgi:hypothetical protein